MTGYVFSFNEITFFAFALWLLAMGMMFGLIWQVSRISMVGRERSRLSSAQHDLAGGMVIVSFGVSASYLLRWFGDAEFDPLPYRVAARLILMTGLVITTWAGVRVVSALGRRLRDRSAYPGISQERILATVAVDLPMIVSDQQGVIVYATEPMEELAGAKPGELDGLNLTEIMPERYRAHHSAGVERFVKTGISRIIGKVIDVDLLRRDGTEIPVSLALTASEAEEQKWFIGCLWARETYDQPATEGVNIRQDDREVHQNEEDANLEIRRSQQDERENRQAATAEGLTKREKLLDE